MKSNGLNLEFALPEEVNYGVAIKGIKDTEGIFKPIRITLQENREPNVSIGEQSCDLELKLKISDLEEGENYALLRYSNYKDLPTEHI